MGKRTLALLVFLAAGMQNLVADERKLTVQFNPVIKGSGKIYLSGDEYRRLENPQTTGEGKFDLEADYNGIAGAKIELKGALKNGQAFGLGDNAYAYVHILEAFGIDKRIFDAYLKSGRFELKFGEKGGKLKRDGQINTQLDLKVLNMLTLRIGIANPFDEPGNQDIGFSLHFDKTFAEFHKITASMGYSVDLSNEHLAKNTKDMAEDKAAALRRRALLQGRLLSEEIVEAGYFDQFGVELAYEYTFGAIQIKPFLGVTVQGLIASPRYSFVNPMIGWNLGAAFTLNEADYVLLCAQLELEGKARKNNNYKSAGKDSEAPYIANEGFQSAAVTLESHALKRFMGRQYLSMKASARFDFNDPHKFESGADVQRKGFLTEFTLYATQRLIATDDVNINAIFGFGIENITPYYLDDGGFLSAFTGGYLENFTDTQGKDEVVQAYIEIGLEANLATRVEYTAN